MTDTTTRTDTAQYGVAALLAAVGAYTVYDATTLNVGFGDPVGPRAFPYVIGIVLVGLAVLLALATARGDVPEAEAGEDVDLDAPADLRTVALLTGVFLAFAALIGPLGFPVSGALLFWGSAYALGSRHLDRDPLIAAGLSLLTYFVFDNLLGVPLPGGPLMGVL